MTNWFIINLYVNICWSFLLNSVPVVLVGNKKDLHMDRVVSEDEGRRLAVSWKAVFLEASAKQNEVSLK